VSAPDILVYVHIPKCAGTAVRVWLKDAAVEGAITGFRALYPDRHIYLPNEAWPSANDARLVAVSSHNIRRYPPKLGARRLHYATILRDPRAQAISALRYTQQERSAFGIPASVGAASIDIARWMLERTGADPLENAQTNHIALYEWCDATRGRVVPELYGSWPKGDRAAYERDRLSLAKSLLRKFITVGTAERLAESLHVMRTRSTEYGLNLLPPSRVTVTNVTEIPDGDDISWIDRDPLGARLLESLAVDYELYAYGQELLEKALAATNAEPV
jgi:hypothetical protein